MNIQPIVEGFGEVQAVPVLLRRLRDAAAAFTVDVSPPIRKKRHELVNRRFAAQGSTPGSLAAGVPRRIDHFRQRRRLPRRTGPEASEVGTARGWTVPCAVVMATREYEAWFLATIESLRGKRGIRADAVSHANPESPAGPKERLGATHGAKGRATSRLPIRRL